MKHGQGESISGQENSILEGPEDQGGWEEAL